MTALLIFLLLLLAIIGYLFFAPFYLEIDTINGILRARFHKLAYAQVFIRNSALMLYIRIGWWYKDILVGTPGRKPEKKNENEKTHRRKARKIPFRRMRNVARSFKLNKCFISIDTGSIPRNALLFPLLWELGERTGTAISINFQGDDEVVLEIENSLARMAWAFIKQ